MPTLYTHTLRAWITGDGILHVTFEESVEYTDLDLQSVREFVRAYTSSRIPCILDRRLPIVLTAEVLSKSTAVFRRHLSALAVVVSEQTENEVMEEIETIVPKTLPCKVFYSEEEALNWLLPFRDTADRSF